MRKLETEYYRLKEGDTLQKIAMAQSVPLALLIAENHLKEEPRAGFLLRLPEKGTLYTVRSGDSKQKLFGGEEGYEEKNKTSIFFIGMQIFL